jgi:hypothetical protein
MIEFHIARLLRELGSESFVPFKHRFTARNEDTAAMATQPVPNGADRISWFVVMRPNVLAGMSEQKLRYR